jgi:hypothetical protein
LGTVWEDCHSPRGNRTEIITMAPWKTIDPPKGRPFLARARRIDGAQFAAVVVNHTDGKWRLAEIPDGSMMDLVIDSWTEIPLLRNARRARRKASRRVARRVRKK